MSLFKRSQLRDAALRNSITKSFAEAKFTKLANSDIEKEFDIFLSHSSLDATEIEALVAQIEAIGYSVYVDWIVDPYLDRKRVNGETAMKLRERMKRCKCLFFATSDNAQNSKWMPWELGYFDGLRGKVAILPVVDDGQTGNSYSGQEYLSIYPYIVKERLDKATSDSLWVHQASNIWVNFNDWLKSNKQPTLKS